MSKASPKCIVRLTEERHQSAKFQAFKEGKTLQEFVAECIDARLKNELMSTSWQCQPCGKWNLSNTKMAHIGRCEKCGKKDLAVFPIWEKK